MESWLIEKYMFLRMTEKHFDRILVILDSIYSLSWVIQTEK